METRTTTLVPAHTQRGGKTAYLRHTNSQTETAFKTRFGEHPHRNHLENNTGLLDYLTV